MAIRSGPKSGIVSAWLAASTIPNPRPTPVSAMSRGRPIATTDPNASSMIRTAAVMPIPSLEPGAADTTLSAGVPPTATCRPGRAKPSAVWMTSSAAELGKSPAVVSNWTTANPVRESADSWCRPPGASGLLTDDTCGRGRMADTSRAMLPEFWPLVSGSGECMTMSTVAPACAGNRASSTSCARCDAREAEA
jgi:hypothetical protein